MTKPYTMTVREFKDSIVSHVANLPDDSEIYFGTGNLSFQRVKPRQYSDDSKTVATLLQIEFNQVYDVAIDPEVEN
ncbi:hypothetical protein [Burkholderia diffusa]|uniref:hypothetical protein n=1 Tax=Burkholderia diffusa TaxID=488732 RepID=UPI00158A2B82|nr:hypothetical protein [Burkholderia diffusa]